MKIKNQMLISLFTVASVCASGTALAAVKVFQTNAQPVVIQETVSANVPNSMGFFDIKDSVGFKKITRFINRHRAAFGLQNIGVDSLMATKTIQDEFGNAIRFGQQWNNVTIEGGEAVALMNNDGYLQTIHSTLADVPADFSVTPTISREQALQIAIATLGFEIPELGKDRNDGLLIAMPEPGRPTLVWQFSIREQNLSKAMQVQVGAQGANAGQIVRAISIGDSIANISIYDGSILLVIPNPIYRGVKVLENGKKTFIGNIAVSQDAWDNHEIFTDVLNFYSNTFHRNSFDNQGAPISSTVNTLKHSPDLLGQRENAAWMGPWKLFTFGAGGERFAGFASSRDVVGHEFTHAVISSTCNLTYVNQSGGLNEHLADVFGVMIQSYYEPSSDPYLIGETVLRGEFKQKYPALRHMKEPKRGVTAQPEHMNEIPERFGPYCQPSGQNDNCGVHYLSGIPNKAIAIIQSKLGWTVMENLFYRVMTVRLLSTSQFKDYRDMVVDECHNMLAPGHCQVVEEAFAVVGL